MMIRIQGRVCLNLYSRNKFLPLPRDTSAHERSAHERGDPGTAWSDEAVLEREIIRRRAGVRFNAALRQRT
jgi:hypothetical protein